MKYLYRSVNILLALAVFPIVIFLDLIKFRIGDNLGNIGTLLGSLGIGGDLLGGLANGESSSLLPVGLEEGISIKFIIEVITGKGEAGATWHQLLMNSSETGKMGIVFPESLNEVKGHLIALVVFFAIILIAALFIIVWSCISNKRIPIVAATGTGIISLIVMRMVFEPVREVLGSTFSITDLLADGGILATLADAVIKLEDVIFGSFWIVLLFDFILLAIWTASFYLIEIGDTPEEKALAQAKRKKR